VLENLRPTFLPLVGNDTVDIGVARRTCALQRVSSSSWWHFIQAHGRQRQTRLSCCLPRAIL